MADFKDVVQVAVDAYNGKLKKYSVDDSMELLRKAAIEANGGSTIIDYKRIRDGKCNGLFALIEEILSRTISEGFQNDDYFMSLVDYRNLALGDKNEFYVEDNDLFAVAEAAEGTQGIRRQRLMGMNRIEIPTKLYVVKIYEELNRMLSGQVDFNKMIQKVAESFRQHFVNNIYSIWEAATAADFGGNVYFPAAGAYNEDTLLTLVEHVEAAAGGKNATIIGTKKALRNLAPSIQGTDSKSDLYNLGYYGKFYGADCVALPQRHQVNTTNFLFDDNTLTIIATGEKPLKVVYEGDSIVIMGDPFQNADLTQNYMYGERYGVGIVMAGNGGIGRYTITPSNSGSGQ